MKNNFTFIALAAIILSSTKVNAQVIISQDFEGPLTGWTNQGTLTSTQNSITAHSGGGMLALSTGSALTSPTFALPSGAKNVSFWLNSFNDAPFGYSFTADLLQNGTSVLTLGSWMSDIYSAINPWSQISINIPSGFSGNDYSITFKVQSFTNPNLRFYLDDIYLSTGAVGLKDNNALSSDIKVINDVTNKTLKIYPNTNLENNEIQITSIDGKVIFTKQSVDILKSSYYEINLPEVNEGLYILKVSNTTVTFAKKLAF
ncbi:MAG: T9SS type A sorting domain-containing protein [Bacteroidota bacterium]|nr:T9SS type A sorting domain-containing protein [Bacteroidota bacterium]